MKEHQVSNLPRHLTEHDTRLLARLHLLAEYVTQSPNEWRPFYEWVQRHRVEVQAAPLGVENGFTAASFIADQELLENALGEYTSAELLDLAFPHREGDGM